MTLLVRVKSFELASWKLEIENLINLLVFQKWTQERKLVNGEIKSFFVFSSFTFCGFCSFLLFLRLTTHLLSPIHEVEREKGSTYRCQNQTQVNLTAASLPRALPRQSKHNKTCRSYRRRCKTLSSPYTWRRISSLLTRVFSPNSSHASERSAGE